MRLRAQGTSSLVSCSFRNAIVPANRSTDPMKFKMLLALTASFTTIGCATGGLTGQGDSRAISQSARQSAAQQHPEAVAEFGGTVDANRHAYVAGVGSQEAVQTGTQGPGTGPKPH